MIDGKLDPQVARVAIDAEKWLAAKKQPKVFGEKVTNELVGKNGGPIVTEEKSPIETARRIAYVLGVGLERVKAKRGADECAKPSR
jgi:hypothetical protein